MPKILKKQSAQASIKSAALKNNENEKTDSAKNPSFSFRYLTGNPDYNFEHFAKSKNDKRAAYDAFINELVKLSAMTWRAWYGMARDKGGIEKIPCAKVKSCLHPVDNAIDGLLVARFNSGKYRLLGYQDGEVFFITGFDFDFSAYDHG